MSKNRLSITCLTAAATMSIAMASSASAQMLEEGKAYQMQAGHSERCIDVAGGSADAGADMIQFDCHGNANQQFYPSYIATDSFGHEYYKFLAAHSEYCLGFDGMKNFSSAVQDDCASTKVNNAIHDWKLIARDGGYQMVNVGSKKCLDISGASAENAAKAHAYDCHDGANQTFYFTAVE